MAKELEISCLAVKQNPVLLYPVVWLATRYRLRNSTDSVEIADRRAFLPYQVPRGELSGEHSLSAARPRALPGPSSRCTARGDASLAIRRSTPASNRFSCHTGRFPKNELSVDGHTVWGEVFGDRVIATAILDRLLHHSTIVNIKGESYRLKEKRKAGLLTRSEPYTDPVSRPDSGAPLPEPALEASR